MKALKIAAILPCLFLVSSVLWAATQYGEAVIERGSMTIIREGRTLNFDQANQAVPVNEQDLIRVRPDSLVQLKSRENATMTLGANAVFEVKPWQSHGRSGFLRALFGRFRAAVATLSGGQQFNVKTATATIGVKGTEYLTQVTSRGGTMLVVTNHIVGFQGQTGGESDVNQGFLALIINYRPPTKSAPLPEGFGDLFKDLGSPNPNTPGAGHFVGEHLLIQSGILTQDELNELLNGGEGGEHGAGFVPAINFDPNAAHDASRLGTVKLQF
ncbi:MAG TPA: FecR family protein [bacterium]|nr:FecR family protein [bacterium]